MLRILTIALGVTLSASTLFGQSSAGGGRRDLGGIDPLESHMGHGISLELATWRAKTIADVRYDLALDVTGRDSAIGHVRVQFKRTGNSDAIVDWRGRRLIHASANGTVFPVAAANGAHIRIPAAILISGANTVDFDFVADIAPSGASIIRTHDPDGSDYLYTLLVPADADQLFPCFDQPDLKTRLTFTLTTPAEWTALANGSVTRADTSIAEHRITTHFAETKPLSTYLIAFAAGPWSHASSTVNGRTINVYIRKSRFAEADPDTLLTLAHRAVSWMENYFGRPYPFEKFDFMLAPAFPFGGMEHPGVVMFNEDRFVFRDRPTLARRLGRESTILHEVAHQWFGDLVTMRWFDDLWLKEGFATYMAAKAMDQLEPASDAWKVFYLANKPTAYGVDQTEGTTPLWQDMANLDQAKSAYGAIVYNKAPSVLKQLNYLVGEHAFRAGVQTFLTDHAYANATWQDLLGAIGHAADRSLDEFGKNFMLRPGMAEVEPRILIDDGKVAKLELLQRPVQRTLSGSAAWPMRTSVLLGYLTSGPTKIPAELTGPVSDVPGARGMPAPAFVFPNADDYGYFLSLMDSSSVVALEQGAFGTITDSFLRAMLWGALWDQVRDARMDPVRFARLVLKELPRERDEQILPSLLGRVDRDIRAYLSPAAQDEIRPGAERVFWAGANDRTRPYGARRGYLDAFIGVAATPDGISKLRLLLAADSAAGEPVRDPMRLAVVDRLLVLDVPVALELVAAHSARDKTVDGKRRAFTAGAARNRRRSRQNTSRATSPTTSLTRIGRAAVSASSTPLSIRH